MEAVEAARELGHGGGVGDADVFVGAEGFAGHYGDVGFGEKSGRKIQ